MSNDFLPSIAPFVGSKVLRHARYLYTQRKRETVSILVADHPLTAELTARRPMINCNELVVDRVPFIPTLNLILPSYRPEDDRDKIDSAPVRQRRSKQLSLLTSSLIFIQSHKAGDMDQGLGRESERDVKCMCCGKYYSCTRSELSEFEFGQRPIRIPIRGRSSDSNRSRFDCESVPVANASTSGGRAHIWQVSSVCSVLK